MQYFLTVEKRGEELIRRQPFDDYGDAINFVGQYFTPRSQRSVLNFTTEAINGKFARSYVSLNRPGDLAKNDVGFERRYEIAVKYSNAFDYDDSYFFMIESEVGIADCDDYDEDDDDDLEN